MSSVDLRSLQSTPFAIWADAQVTLDTPLVAVESHANIVDAFRMVVAGGPELADKLRTAAAATRANHYLAAKSKHAVENALANFMTPVASISTIAGSAASIELSSLGLLTMGVAVAASAGLLVTGAGAAAVHYVRKSKAIREGEKAQREAANEALTSLLADAVAVARDDGMAAFAYSRIAQSVLTGRTKMRDLVLDATREGHLRTLAEMPIDSQVRSRAERFIEVENKLLLAQQLGIDSERATYTADALNRAVDMLTPDERNALAPLLMNAMFDARECMHNPVARKVATRLFSTLLAAGGRTPVEVTPPAEPLTTHVTQRFAEQVLAFEGELASAIADGAKSLPHALETMPRSIAQAIVDTDAAVNGATFLNTVIGKLSGRRPILNRGLDPTLVSAAIARAEAAWVTPLERAGFAFAATRYLSALDTSGLYCTAARPALERIASVGTPADAARAKHLCRAIFAINETRPGMGITAAETARSAFKKLDHDDRAAVARAMIPQVFPDNVRKNQPMQLVSSALHKALEN